MRRKPRDDKGASKKSAVTLAGTVEEITCQLVRMNRGWPGLLSKVSKCHIARSVSTARYKTKRDIL